MKIKNSLKKAENYLILVSIICFSIVFYFKEKTLSRFNEFDSKQSDFMLEIENEDVKVFFENFEKRFEALMAINRDIKPQVDKLKNAKPADEDFKANLKIFQNEIKETQKKLNFAYDMLLYFSFFILVIAIFVIFHKNFEKTKELSAIKMLDETQNSFSRDLHDTVIQDLKTLKIYLDKDDSESKEMRNYYLNQAYNEARYLMSSINNIDFNEEFITILQKTLKAFESNHKIRTQFYASSKEIQNFELKRKVEFYRIFQESLNNIARHSKATLVTVKIIDVIQKDLTQITRIQIIDNGIGIKNEDFEKENHFGLKNIKERAELSGGKVTIKNNVENGEKSGTAITIEY